MEKYVDAFKKVVFQPFQLFQPQIFSGLLPALGPQTNPPKLLAAGRWAVGLRSVADSEEDLRGLGFCINGLTRCSNESVFGVAIPLKECLRTFHRLSGPWNFGDHFGTWILESFFHDIKGPFEIRCTTSSYIDLSSGLVMRPSDWWLGWQQIWNMTYGLHLDHQSAHL